MRTFTRYLLLQIPGWVLVGIVLYAAHAWAGLRPSLALLLLLAYVLKDFVLYPVLRRAYEGDEPAGPAALLGRTGEAIELLDPEGYVRVDGELWRARARVAPIRPGERIKVCGTGDGVLEVEPVPASRC